MPDGAGGRRAIYLGVYDSPESREEYERVLASLRLSPTPTAPTPIKSPTVAEALLAYVRHVKGYYPERSAKNHLEALRPVRLAFAPLPLREFSPRAFKSIRQALIDRSLSRTTINGRMQKVAQFVKWCVAEELADPALFQAVATVPGLRRGRGEAKELPPVRPPADADLERVIGHVNPTVAALVRVQALCGARAGELVGLRAEDLERAGPVWKVGLGEHKGAWRGKGRTLYFGPRAQEVLAPLAAKGGLLFPHRRGRAYTTPSYRQALKRGCRRAGVAEFGTHALRHYAATRIRALADVETARVLLGHSDKGLTAAVYAERDERKVTEALARVG